jgi:uncharacterized protein with NRDE domain
MCTVSFLPLPDGGYLLGTNRDESPRRGPALPPAVHEVSGRKLLMPRDSDAGGTWVAADDRGRCLCVLNGDRPAAPVPSEAPSRGTLLIELAVLETPAAMLQELQDRHAAGRLTQRAFKLLVVEPGRDGRPARATQIDWNGRDLPSSRSHPGPAAFVSNSFDPEGVALRRQHVFSALSSVPAQDPEALAVAQTRWHAAHSEEAPDGDTYTVCMHREEAATVSYTAVRVDAHRVQMGYVEGPPCEGRTARKVSLDRSG